MSPCHNLEPSLVARDSSRLLRVKPNEWMHLSPFYTRMHGEWLRYAKSTSQFHWRFLLVRDVRGFQVNPLCRHDITSPFPPSGNGGYVCNLDVLTAPIHCWFTVDQNSSKQILSVDFEQNSETMNWSHVDYFWIIVMFVQNLLVNCVKRKKIPTIETNAQTIQIVMAKKHQFVWEILFL